VALDQALRLAHCDIRLELIVLDDQLDLTPTELATELLDRELETVALLLPKHGRRSGQRGQQTYLQFLLGAGSIRYQRECRGRGKHRRLLDHGFPLFSENYFGA